MKQNEIIPGLIYGVDGTGTPRPLQCDINGKLIVAGLNITLPSTLSQVSGAGGSGTNPKNEIVIMPVTAKAAAGTYYSLEFQSNARNLSIFLDMQLCPGNFTATLQTKASLTGFVDLISFGIIAGVAGVYNLETPLYAKIFRMSFLEVAGAFRWAAYGIESF